MKLEEIEKKEYIDKGDFSKCYDIGNHNVLKLFNNSMSIADIHKFKYLLKYRNESFLFPFEFVYDEENYKYRIRDMVYIYKFYKSSMAYDGWA